MTIKSEFIASCEAFIGDMGISATAFGELAAGQRNFMTRLRAGQSTSVDRVDAVYKYMRAERRKKK